MNRHTYLISYFYTYSVELGLNFGFGNRTEEHRDGIVIGGTGDVRFTEKEIAQTLEKEGRANVKVSIISITRLPL